MMPPLGFLSIIEVELIAGEWDQEDEEFSSTDWDSIADVGVSTTGTMGILGALLVDAFLRDGMVKVYTLNWISIDAKDIMLNGSLNKGLEAWLLDDRLVFLEGDVSSVIRFMRGMCNSDPSGLLDSGKANAKRAVAWLRVWVAGSWYISPIIIVPVVLGVFYPFSCFSHSVLMYIVYLRAFLCTYKKIISFLLFQQVMGPETRC